MGTIGSDLRQAREAAGLSREELAKRTKIRPSLLDAMERDDFGRLPPGLLGRGHLRAYAKEVHLDPDRIVERFGREWMTEPTPVIPPPVDSGESRIPVGTILVGLVLVAALAILVRTIRLESGAGEVEAVGTAGRAADEAPSAVGGATATDADRSSEASVAPPVTAPPALTLELHATNPVWVEARADGRRVLYTLVMRDDTPVIEATREIQLRVGNAGAIDYSINGRRGRPFGRPGEVRDVRITPQNLATFQEGQAATP